MWRMPPSSATKKFFFFLLKQEFALGRYYIKNYFSHDIPTRWNLPIWISFGPAIHADDINFQFHGKQKKFVEKNKFSFSPPIYWIFFVVCIITTVHIEHTAWGNTKKINFGMFAFKKKWRKRKKNQRRDRCVYISKTLHKIILNSIHNKKKGKQWFFFIYRDTHRDICSEKKNKNRLDDWCWWTGPEDIKKEKKRSRTSTNTKIWSTKYMKITKMVCIDKYADRKKEIEKGSTTLFLC